jgi:putative endonuclease
MPLTTRQLQGNAGEDEALAHLQQHGLVLVERNFRCKGGEIDLIMRDGAGLVFVEVRQRAGRGFGGAAASVTPAKQRRLIHAAQFYLLRMKPLPPCRFDLVAIDGGKLSWLKNVLDGGS